MPGMDKDKTQASVSVPPEFARAMNLMAQPMAGMMGMSALGVTVAAQAFGIWASAVSGAIAASQRSWPVGRESPISAAFRETKASPSERAKIAADSLMADAKASSHAAPSAAPVAHAKVAAKARAAAPVVAPEAAGTNVTALRKPPSAARAQSPDDLKVIAGIGPKLEQVLNGFGIWTYAQIAALSDAQIGLLEDKLGFRGRIGRDDWVGQATKLRTVRQTGLDGVTRGAGENNG
jgi:NADH-quinone oxidoreductase subunit E